MFSCFNNCRCYFAPAKNYSFVIATPPNVHYVQVKAVIESGRDVFVEKPAFLSHNEFDELSRLASERGLVLVEMLMYLENNSVQKIIRELKEHLDRLRILNPVFNPSVPLEPFTEDLGNSLLSDMACYPLSISFSRL